MRDDMYTSRRLLLLACALLVACEAPPSASPDHAEHAEHAEHADHAHEVVVSAREIQAQWSEEGGFLVSPVLDAPDGATRVAALVSLVTPDEQRPPFEARGLDAEGNPGEWRPFEITWAEETLFVGLTDIDFLAQGAQLRLPAESFEALVGVQWLAVVPAPEPDSAPPTLEGDVGRATEALRAEYAAAGVIPRESWGARATRCSDTNPSKNRIAIHHTAGLAQGDPATLVRGVQALHMDGNRWCDIGYHFLVSIDGRVYEGRPVQLLGSHVGGHNTGNLGISLMGCFDPHRDCTGINPSMPPDAMIQATADMVRLSAQLYGISITRDSVKGHRDHSGNSTVCPGSYVHSQLDRIRALASDPVDFAAAYVEQSFPLASQPFELRPGERSNGYLEMRNTGSESWEPGMTFLGTTEPRDGASPLVGPDWPSPHRAATIDRSVAPGETGRFVFTVQAPLTPGDYPQFFNLIQEGVAWFSDPGQGGPPDGQLQIRVTVVDGPPVTYDGGVPAGTDAGTPGDAGARMSDAGAMNERDAGPSADGGPDRPMADGCGCHAVGSGSRSAPILLAMLGLALVLRRRRARR